MFHAETETATQCSRCRYDLREIAKKSVCPECGLPVAITLRDPESVRLDQQWLAALERGRRWLTRVFPAVVIIGSVLVTVLGGTSYAFIRVPIPYFAMVFGAFAALAAGIFLFTDESCLHWLTPMGQHFRFATRLFALLPLLLILIGIGCLELAAWDVLEVVAWFGLGLLGICTVLVLLFGGFCKNVATVLVDEELLERWHRYRVLIHFSWIAIAATSAGAFTSIDGLGGFFALSLMGGGFTIVFVATRTFLMPIYLADRISALQSVVTIPIARIVDEELVSG